jgi:Uma2 family endonuclease
MTSVALPGVYRLTFQDWLAFPDDGRLYELIQGEVHVTPPPGIEHQRISRDLEFKLLTFLRERAAGEVLDAPVGVRLSDEDVFEPDLVVVLAEHADRIGAQVIDGAPDLVVEILSPGTAGRDLGPKRQAYLRAGVPEYWIVDPASQAIEVLALERGEYVRSGLYRRGDTLRSPLLAGLEIALQEIFAAR